MAALDVLAFGDAALLVRTRDQADVHSLTAALLEDLGAGRLVDVVPGDRTILVRFDGTDAGEARARSALAAAATHPRSLEARRRVVIPVVYGGAAGPDLDAVADLVGLTPAAVIDAHTGRDQPVLFLGFAPGFVYLGDLDPRLAVSRLATPRTVTPAGSVAIAEGYTGIYPADLPGGWRVIGRTAMPMFDPSADPPAPLQPGDLVRFEAVAG
jgi:KipI family sensor histidine kinase inhibitor